MRGGLIIWDADNVQHLQDMIDLTKDEGLMKVYFVNGRRSKFSSDEATHAFTIPEAEGLLAEARAALAANPMPVFPPNLEGREP